MEFIARKISMKFKSYGRQLRYTGRKSPKLAAGPNLTTFQFGTWFFLLAKSAYQMNMKSSASINR